MRCLLIFLIGHSLLISVLCTPNRRSPYSIPSPSSISATSSEPIFGVRGGAGFFGFGRKQSQNSLGLDKGSAGDRGIKTRNGGDDDDDNDDDDKHKKNNKPNPSKSGKFPALSKVEIEEKLNIPIFGITDTNGNGVILSDGEGKNVFHFFFSRHMADAALRAVTAANVGAPELKVSAFHLGKCWFKLIDNSGEKEFKLQKYGKDSTTAIPLTTKPVHFRLVPNMKDLLGARILTGLQPPDVQNLKTAIETQPVTPTSAKTAISILRRASEDATAFTSPFDQIPVFAIAQMRVRKKDEDGNSVGNPMLPMHLSTKTMSETWNEFIKYSPQFEDAEATLQLVELHKMVEMMQNDSDFDFRNVVFMIPSYDENDLGGRVEDSEEGDSESDDDDDDGGGGDFGRGAERCEDVLIEPFVSMEVYTDMSGQTLNAHNPVSYNY